MNGAVWLTDVHLNFVAPDERQRLARTIAARRPSHVLIGGDIGEADTFAGYLREWSETIRAPIYFVLGNHDYYRGSIDAVRQAARDLHRHHPQLHWLPQTGVVALDSATALIGHGGWGDARAGDFRESTIVLNDYALIEDLRRESRPADSVQSARFDFHDILTASLQRKLQQLGDEAAAHLQQSARLALHWASEVIVLMHVPPFREACWYEGRMTDDNWAPHFVCAAAGVALSQVMAEHPDRRMTVLCGHTHNAGRAQILPNLTVITGGAVYKQPVIQTDWPPPPASTPSELTSRDSPS